MSELSEQFQAALVGYDEGLHDDRHLAAAVWRRFYALSPDANAEDVERIVKFVRQQVGNGYERGRYLLGNFVWINVVMPHVKSQHSHFKT